MQILQKALTWCPNAEKVFVSPTGQVVDPATVQQQTSSDPGNDQSQAQGSLPPPTPPPPLPPRATFLPPFPPSTPVYNLRLKRSLVQPRASLWIMPGGTVFIAFSLGSTDELCIAGDVTAAAPTVNIFHRSVAYTVGWHRHCVRVALLVHC